MCQSDRDSRVASGAEWTVGESSSDNWNIKYEISFLVGVIPLILMKLFNAFRKTIFGSVHITLKSSNVERGKHMGGWPPGNTTWWFLFFNFSITCYYKYKATSLAISLFVEPPSKTNRLGVCDLLWKCAICTVLLWYILHTFTVNYVHPSGWFCSVGLYFFCFCFCLKVTRSVLSVLSVLSTPRGSNICSILQQCKCHDM